MSASQPAPTSFPPGYLEESKQDNLYAAAAIPYFFALVAVALRFWSRQTMRAGLWLDDWLIFTAVLCGLGLMIDTFWWTPRGFGKHVEAFANDEELYGHDVSYYFSLGLFIAELTYTGVIVFVKYSIIALYWRIFNTTNIKIPLLVFGFIVTAWGIAVFLLSLLQCIPTEGYWDKTIPAMCNVNAQQFLFGISIPNILVDVALLVLPIPYILRLNMNTSQKQVLCSLFSLGGFVCVASILRLVSVVQESSDPDVTWSFVNQGIWALVESDFAIIGASLPCLRPVWLKIRPKLFVIQTSQTAKSSKPTWTIGGGNKRSSKRSKRTRDPLYDQTLGSQDDTQVDNGHLQNPPSNSVSNLNTDAIPLENYGAPGSQIEVKKDWSVQYHGP